MQSLNDYHSFLYAEKLLLNSFMCDINMSESNYADFLWVFERCLIIFGWMCEICLNVYNYVGHSWMCLNVNILDCHLLQL